MCVKNILVRVWGILVLCCLTFASEGWKPIVPPPEYYATKPTTCVADCETAYQHLQRSEDGSTEVDTRIASIIAAHPLAFTKDESLPGGTAKIDLEIIKPPYFIQGEKDSQLAPTYREVLKKSPSPSTFVQYKRFGPPLTVANPIYINQFDIVKSDEIRHGSDGSQGSGSELKIYVKPSTNYLGGDFESFKLATTDNQCSLYKVSFRQDLYSQYVQYKVKMPDLIEFTICLWLRLHKVGHDHSLFSYSSKLKKNDIYLWVSNLHEPSLFQLKVLGQTIFRLNYPIKLYKWYHTCQSWNGKTGEWQVWVGGNRIGRGYHNLLVNHQIEGGGIAMSGQQYRHFPKGYHEISSPHYKPVEGLEGEIAMLQFYKVALTAGKAYNDHRHHHSHFTTTTPEPPEESSEEPEVTTVHPLLENGQLKTHVNILELIKSLKYAKEHLHLHEGHLPHQHYVNHISLPFHGNELKFIALPNHSIFKRDDAIKAQTSQVENKSKDQETEAQKVAEVKVVRGQGNQVRHVEKEKFAPKEEKDNGGGEVDDDEDDDQEDDNIMLELLSAEKSDGSQIVTSKSDSAPLNFTELYLSEQESKEESAESNRTSRYLRVKRQNNPRKFIVYPGKRKAVIATEPKTVSYVIRTKQTRPPPKRTIKTPKDNEKAASKRNVLFPDTYTNLGINLGGQGSYATLGNIPSYGFSFDEDSNFNNDFSDAGGDQGGENDQRPDGNPLHQPENFNVKTPQRELAENEVRKILEICSGCQPDPFRKVAVISWRSTPKKIFSGALFVRAKPECENF